MGLKEALFPFKPRKNTFIQNEKFAPRRNPFVSMKITRKQISTSLSEDISESEIYYKADDEKGKKTKEKRDERLSEKVTNPYEGPSSLAEDESDKEDEPKDEYLEFLNYIGNYARKNLIEFLYKPGCENSMIKCKIVRMKKMKEIYFLNLEQESNSSVFLVAGVKRIGSPRIKYAITTNKSNSDHSEILLIGTLKANLFGYHFVLMDNIHSVPNPKSGKDYKGNGSFECASIKYIPIRRGYNEPRRMVITLPVMVGKAEKIEFDPPPLNKARNTHENWRLENLKQPIKLYKKPPAQSDEERSFKFLFMDKMKHPSLKKYQIIHESDPKNIILDFAQISQDIFTMDYKFPLNAVQAFAIALSSFDRKFAGE